jgi:pimeloyl-ACP methyl ester carboxylesterase
MTGSSQATKARVRVFGHGPPVVLVHGSLTADPWEEDWDKQHSLAGRYELRVLTRRGYGDTPPVPRRDFEMDVRDVIEALGEGAHLVGHSYGAGMSLLAGARRPDLVKSLAVVEPPVFAVARGHPAVQEMLGRLTPLYNSVEGLSAEDYFRRFRAAIAGRPPSTGPIELTPLDIKGIRAAMLEKPAWEVAVPLEELAAAPFPRLVFSGNWQPAFSAVCDVLEQRAGFEKAVIEGGGHLVSSTGEPFNERLEAFWQAVDSYRA